MEKINPWYVTGFSDGESAFTYSRSGNNLNLYFAIRLNFEDRDLLYRIQEYFGAGKIYVQRPTPPTKNSGHSRTSFYYRISKISDLGKVIDHFDRYPLQGKKAMAYSIWKKMAELKQSYRKPDREEIDRLANSISFLTNKNNKWMKRNG